MNVDLPRVCVSTFSIVAFDRKTKDLGIAVQSKFISVGSVVPWAAAGVGAIATQAYANTSYGPRGLEMMRKGVSAGQTIRKLTSSDRDSAVRQVGIVDADGTAASYTGKKCMPWAGGIEGSGFAVQGNILVGKETVEAMAETYEKSRECFPERLLSALQAGQDAGGDSRGMQSAALLIVRKKGGYGGFNDRYVDLRVEDHKTPIAELARIFRLYDLVLLSREKKEDMLDIDSVTCRVIQSNLKRLGYYSGGTGGRWNSGTEAALSMYISVNNFENKAAPKGHIWKSVLEFMKNDARERK